MNGRGQSQLQSPLETPGAAPTPAGTPAEDPLLLWQLSDSAFPTGGFAHSGGLEAAWQHGEIRQRDDLLSFLHAALVQAGRSALPFVTAAYAEPDRLPEFDRLCDAFLSNHVANRASRAQGRALLTAVERIFCRQPPSQRPLQSPIENRKSAISAPLPCSHLAPVFGAAFHRLGLSHATAARLFLFQQLRGLLAAAVRLNIVGPMEAQSVQFRLIQSIESVSASCRSLTLDDLAQTTPLLDLWQSGQDRLYSRLFQS